MYIHGWTCKGDVRLPAGNRPTNHHPYICVLKGIPEYILHMLYCRLISNSIGREASRARGRSGERERGGRRRERERECTLSGAFFTKNDSIRLRAARVQRFSPRFRSDRKNAIFTPHIGKNLFARSIRRILLFIFLRMKSMKIYRFNWTR